MICPQAIRAVLGAARGLRFSVFASIGPARRRADDVYEAGAAAARGRAALRFSQPETGE